MQRIPDSKDEIEAAAPGRTRALVAAAVTVSLFIASAAFAGTSGGATPLDPSHPTKQLDQRVSSPELSARASAGDDDGAGDDVGVTPDDAVWGIDDDAADECEQFTVRNDSTTCHAVDDGYCDYQFNTQLDDDAIWHIDLVGCGDCSGEWGPCLLSAIANLSDNCDLLDESDNADADAAAARRQRRSRGRRLTRDEMATTATKLPIAALAAEAAQSSPAPTPSPTLTPLPTFDVNSATECDIKAYCEMCVVSTSCPDLLRKAHAGNIPGVEAVGSGESFHAVQALSMIESLHDTCDYARAEGLLRRKR